MDAVELPFPASVAVTKLLPSDAFSGIEESSASACVFESVKVSAGCSSSHKDGGSISNSKDVYGSRSKKREVLEGLLLISKDERNSTEQTPAETARSEMSSPKHGCQQSHKKFIGSSSRSGMKRQRTEQQVNLGTSYLNKCNYSEKSRTIRQKNVQDGKRCDRKNFKASGKTKIDSFVSKNGLACTDSVCGKNILGIYGLKVDFHNVTNAVDDPSLEELLDGSYVDCNPSHGKGKRGQTAIGSIVSSVRRACSILQFHASSDGAESSVSPCAPISNSTTISATDCGDADKFTEETLPTEEDSRRETSRKSLLYHPKDVMKKLKLPATPDLASLLHELSLTSSGSVDAHDTSLPPFAWSVSHSGPSKPCVDAGKLTTSRSTCQSKWVRIENCRNSIAIDHSCFAEPDQMLRFTTDDPSLHHKLNTLLRDVRTMTRDFSLPCYSRDKELSAVGNSLESCSKVDDFSHIGPDVLSLDDSLKDSGSHLKCSLEGLHNPVDTDGSMPSEEKRKTLPDPSSANFVLHMSPAVDKERPAVVSHGCISKNTFYKNYADEEKQSSIYSGIRPGCCPEACAAAETLCDLAKKSDALRKSDPSRENIRRHDINLQIPVKSSKSTASSGNTERNFTVGRSSSLVKSAGIISSARDGDVVSGKKSKVSSVDNLGRGHIRWDAASAESNLSVKLNNDFPVNRKQPHRDSYREMGSSPALGRIHKISSSNRDFKERKVATTSYAVAGMWGKDLYRGKTRGRNV